MSSSRGNKGKGKGKGKYDCTRESSVHFNLREIKHLTHIVPLLMEYQNDRDGRIYKCEVDKIQGIQSGGKRVLTVVSFPSHNQALNYSNIHNKPNDFKAFTMFERDNNTFLVGSYIGVPLRDWIFENNNDFWHSNWWETPQPKELLRKSGKKIAKILTRRHEQDDYVGDLSNSVYIDPRTLEITLLSFDEKESIPEDGIAADLQQFGSLIGLTAGRTSSTYLTLFYELYNLHLPSNLEGLKQKSYIICHAPLFWGFKQRYSFAFNFWAIRKSNKIAFDSKVKLNSGITDVGEWWGEVESKNDGLGKVYNNARTNYEREVKIISFHRNSLSHCCEHNPVATQVDVDQELLRLFPDAYPKAYLEVFRNYLPHNPNLINHFKNGSTPLNYGMLPA